MARALLENTAGAHGRVLLALAVVLTWGQEADAVIDVKCVKKTLVTQRYSQEPLFPSLLEGGGVCSAAWLSHQGPSRSLCSSPPFSSQVQFILFLCIFDFVLQNFGVFYNRKSCIFDGD